VARSKHLVPCGETSPGFGPTARGSIDELRERGGVPEECPLVMVIVKPRNWADELARFAEQLLIPVHGLPPHCRGDPARCAAYSGSAYARGPRRNDAGLPGPYRRRGAGECEWNLRQSTLLHSQFHAALPCRYQKCSLLRK
jgi:hypothetical protein